MLLKIKRHYKGKISSARTKYVMNKKVMQIKENQNTDCLANSLYKKIYKEKLEILSQSLQENFIS